MRRLVITALRCIEALAATARQVLAGEVPEVAPGSVSVPTVEQDDGLHVAIGRQQVAIIRQMRQSALALTLRHDIQQGGTVH